MGVLLLLSTFFRRTNDGDDGDKEDWGSEYEDDEFEVEDRHDVFEEDRNDVFAKGKDNDDNDGFGNGDDGDGVFAKGGDRDNVFEGEYRDAVEGAGGEGEHGGGYARYD